jgi:hypothetical protein
MILRRDFQLKCYDEVRAAGEAAPDALRKDPQTLRLLRRRLADIDTLLSDISRNNRSQREGLAATAKDAP